jgi:AcrR family transcriptional regulator
MMAKKQYSKQLILEAAYEITRDEDLSMLSMRNIARRIGCSVMPIYDAFESKEDLIYEVNKYSLHKTLYDLNVETINDRYHQIIEYGFRYPKFFLQFTRFEKTFKHDDAVVCKLCGFLHKDPRLVGAHDREVLKIDQRIEAFIVGIVQTYYTEEYNTQIVEQAKRVVDDTLDALIKHVLPT